MKKLSEVGIDWRDYLYANAKGKFNDAAKFIRDVKIMDCCKNRIIEELLGVEPESKIMKQCISDIASKKAEIRKTMLEFLEFSEKRAEEFDFYVDVEDLLFDISVQGTQSYFYVVAEEWKEWEERLNSIKKHLKEEGYQDVTPVENLLCSEIMNAVYQSLVPQDEQNDTEEDNE